MMELCGGFPSREILKNRDTVKNRDCDPVPPILFFFNYAFPFKKYLLLFIYLAAPVDLVPQPEFEPGPPALGSMES